METATPERASDTIAEPVLVTEAGPAAEPIAETVQAQPAEKPQPVVCIPPTGIALEEIERLALIQALDMSNWVQKDAAELLSISPRVMNYKMRNHGLTETFRERRRSRRHRPSSD